MQVLVKQNLAEQLREEILEGRIPPGAKIVEGTWARHYGVAQSSIREALNILMAEGFVTKWHGRSARVLNLSKQDVIQLYEVRGALEGLAAGLLAERQTPLTDLDALLAEMHQAVDANDVRRIVNGLQRFHLSLLEKTGNSFLLEEGRRLLIPLYDFTLMRALAQGLDGSPWRPGLALHQNILDAIRTAQPFFAAQMVIQITNKFLKTALHVWAENMPGNGAGAPAEGVLAQSVRRRKPKTENLLQESFPTRP